MKKILIILSVIVGLGLFAQPITVKASTAAQEACAGITAAGGSCDSGGAKGAAGDIVLSIINVLSWVVGAVAVIMIIIGGLRYILSGGDSNGISGAKNTILYAIVGLVVVLFAQVIVAFVYKSATTDPTAPIDPNAPTAPVDPNAPATPQTPPAPTTPASPTAPANP